MSATKPDKPAYVSWVVGSPAGPVRHSRLRSWLEYVSWIDLILVIVGVLAYDLCALIGATFAAHSAHCPLRQCGLADEVKVLHDGFWITPLVLALPLLLALILRRKRVVIAILQGLLCLILFVQDNEKLQQTTDRLDGKATCWTNAYSNATCPWGDRG